MKCIYLLTVIIRINIRNIQQYNAIQKLCVNQISTTQKPLFSITKKETSMFGLFSTGTLVYIFTYTPEAVFYRCNKLYNHQDKVIELQ